MSDGRIYSAGDWLALAATPTFTLMALLTAITGDSHPALICSQSQQSWPHVGMTQMYLLMAAFHLVPWFRLTAHLRG